MRLGPGCSAILCQVARLELSTNICVEGAFFFGIPISCLLTVFSHSNQKYKVGAFFGYFETSQRLVDSSTVVPGVGPGVTTCDSGGKQEQGGAGVSLQ